MAKFFKFKKEIVKTPSFQQTNKKRLQLKFKDTTSIKK